MKSLIILLIGIFCICNFTYGQEIYIGFGPNYLADKSISNLHPEVIGPGVWGNDSASLQIGYTHYFKRKYIIDLSYSKYGVSTLYHFVNGNYGWVNATELNRTDLGLGFDLFNDKKLILNPNIFIGLQQSAPTGVGFNGIVPTDLTPDGFVQSLPAEAKSFRTTQFVPGIGVKIGYAFWNRFEIFLDFKQVWGRKKVEELILSYSYNGVLQADADRFTDGTGRFYIISIGYRIGKKWKLNN